MIDETLFDGLSNMCFNLTQLILQTSVVFDLLVIDVHVSFVPRSSFFAGFGAGGVIRIDCSGLSRFLRLLKGSTRTVRVNIVPYVSGYCKPFDDKEPDLPVLLSLEDNV